MSSRGRIAVTDVLWYLVAVAALAGLYPVFADLMASRDIGGAAGVMLWAVPPLLMVVLLAVIYAKARVGTVR